MVTDNNLHLSLPTQDLSRLTLGSDNPKKLQAWVDALPPLNLGETARQLYLFLQELNRLDLDYRKRLPLLEILTPAIDHASRGLGKHYLNQPLVLPEKARKVAGLAQALQGHLANGYKLVAVHAYQHLADKEAPAHLALGCYRALSSLSDALLRCYQLYAPIPSHLWLEIHQLYLLAEGQQLANKTLPQAGGATPLGAYVAILLLASARPNQLRQQENVLIHQAAANWSYWADLHADQTREDLFVVELNMDRGPSYSSQLSTHHAACRYLDTRRLVQQLSLRQEVSELKLPAAMTPSLLSHLRQAWGSLAERSFRRIGQQGSLDLCLGLAAIHYHLSGGQDFHTFVRSGKPETLSVSANTNVFLNQHKQKDSNGGDPWAQAYEPGAAIIGDTINFSNIQSSLLNGEESSSGYDTHQVNKINASPGGYCLSWPGNTPIQLRAGELVAVRDGYPEWAVGVIRWVRQLPEGGAEFGVEIMAPRAQPCAARLVKKTGDEASFMRALLLPALEAVGQPVTLLLPTVGFQVGQRVDMVQGDVFPRLQLTRLLSGTPSYNLYLFRDTAAEAAPATRPATDDNQSQFDSIWSNL